MSPSSYLLFITEEPVSKDLIDYFAQFSIAIAQQCILAPLPPDVEEPLAILIDWPILKNELQALHQFYTSYPVPLLVINDSINEPVCIQVLEAGADDFLVKPLYPRELHARVSAISRRVLRHQQPADQDKEVLVFSNWRLYPASRKVLNEHNEEARLSAGEYDLLYTFVQQPQQILDRELLLQVTKHSELSPFDRRIDVQISRLRQKIELDARKPVLIKTIRNGGYMFTAQVIVLKEGEQN